MARKPLPPISPEEQSIGAAMKIISPVFAALRAAVQASDSRAVADNVTTLKPALAQTIAVWYDMGVAPAAQWAQEGLELSETIEREAAAGRWDIVNLSAGNLNQKCQSCHSIYRERQDDGTYRITPGSY
jgi:cytochrome c556